MPTITKNSISIDGSTQTTSRGDTNPYGPEIMLDGSALADTGSSGLSLSGDNIVIKDLIVSNFLFAGIVLLPAPVYTPATNCVISGCYIGTDASGEVAQGNGTGVYLGLGYPSTLLGSVKHNRIGGSNASERNIISGNGSNVIVYGTDTGSNEFVGNYIGINRTGNTAVGNTTNGVQVYYSNFNTFESNVISGNSPGNGITLIYNGYNHIKNNKIGTNADGTEPVSNEAGVQLGHGAMTAAAYYGHNQISGNQIAGNANGIVLLLADNGSNEITGNYIGTNAGGTAAIPNTGGILLYSPANVIGGETAADRNIISGNTDSGIALASAFGAVANYNTIVGNYIGLDAAGAAALPNNPGGRGAAVDVSSGCYNTIEANVISGNGHMGLRLNGACSNEVTGNMIGTDPTGSANLGNDCYGICLQTGADHNVIGGASAAAQNVIAYNGNSGIVVYASAHNRLLGNYLLLNNQGGSAYVEGGVALGSSAESNVIGPNNIVERTYASAVIISGPAAKYNTVTRNSIFANYFGILLTGEGNENLSAPTISSASFASGNTTVSGTAPASATVELFLADAGQGRTYEAAVSADALGNWSTSLAGNFSISDLVATATDAWGNTSPFSVSGATTSTTTSTTGTVTTTTINATDEITAVEVTASPALISLGFTSKVSGAAVFHVLDLDGRQAAKETIANVNVGANLVTFGTAKRLPRGPYIYAIELNGRIVKRGKFTVVD